MKTMKLFLLLFWLIPLTLQAQEERDEVLDRLIKVDVFAFGPAGRAGAISQGEKDYNEIKSRSTATRDLERLFREGNLQAKCYALNGIQTLDQDVYKKWSALYLKCQDRVSTMVSGLGFTPSLADILAVMNDGAGSIEPFPKNKKIEPGR